MRIDYEDFLRTNRLEIWDIHHRYVARMRELNRIRNGNYATFKKAIENENPEICANAMIGLIKVASYLLSKQITQLERAFMNEGGIRERMAKARVASKSNQQDQAKRR